jgi:hypothetical protein
MMGSSDCTSTEKKIHYKFAWKVKLINTSEHPQRLKNTQQIISTALQDKRCLHKLQQPCEKLSLPIYWVLDDILISMSDDSLS